MKKHIIPAICALFLLSLTARAKGLQLAPAEPLRSAATVHEVHGRQGILIRQRLSFGPYETGRVRRSAIRKWTAVSGMPGVFAAEHMQGRQSIRFSLTDGQDTAEAETVTRVRATDLIIGDRPNSLPNILIDIMATGSALQENNFSGSVRIGNGPEWALFLDNTASQLRRATPAGFLRSDSTYYTIVPVWEVMRKGKVATLPFGAVGLEFRNEQGVACAAVSLIDDGVVFLGDLPAGEKLLLSAACSALLLQSNLD